MNTTTTPEKNNPFSDVDSKSIIEKLLPVRYFLPLLSTLGAILGFSFASSDVVAGIALILIAVGTVSALTVCPLKLLGFPFKCIAVGFQVCRGFIPVYGVADLVAALFGTFLGFAFGLGTVLLAPAFFTIKKFLDEVA